MDVLANVGDEMAKRIATKNGGANPKDSAKAIEKQVTRVSHFSGSSDWRAKGSNDRDKARENHGPAAVFFVEVVGALEMAAAEKEGVFTAIESNASGTANPIADLVASDGAKHDRQQKPLEGNDAGVRKDAGGDQKRVAGKKKADEEAGFNKNDGADERSPSGAD
jgi:hypothetical protein